MSTTWSFSSRYGRRARPAVRFPRFLLLSLALLAVLAGALPLDAAAPSVADGFEPGLGASEPVHAVAVQADGKVLIGGQFTAVDGRPHIGVARLNTDGGHDETFTAQTDGSVFALAVQPDGGILVGGGFTRVGGEPRIGLARLFPDGTVDPDFDPGVAGSVFAIELQPDGGILIGGHFGNVGGVPRSSLARLLPDGRVDLGFDPGHGVDGWVSALALQADGDVVLGGRFDWVDGQSRSNLARVDRHGVLDPLFAPRADAEVRAVRVAPDRRIVVGGDFTEIDGWWSIGLARLLWDGKVETRFSMIPGAPSVYSIALETDGRLLVGGSFPFINGAPRNGVARLTPNGWLDGSFGGLGAQADGQPAVVRSVAVAPDGRPVIGGWFTHADGRPRRCVARLNRDGSADADFFPIPGGAIDAAFPLPDGKVLAIGSFGDVEGRPITNIARLHGDGRLDGSFDAEVDGQISSVALTDDAKIVIGGSFHRAGGQERSWLARLLLDGSADPAFTGVGPNLPVEAVAPLPGGRTLIAGSFWKVGGDERTYLARLHADGTLDGTFDARIAHGPGYEVSSIAVQTDGDVLITGRFATVAGQPRPGIARLHADGSLDTGFVPPATDGSIAALVVQADGRIVIAGNFRAVGGQPRTGLARLERDGSLDDTYRPSLDGGSWRVIRTLALQADGKLLVGGRYLMGELDLVRFDVDGRLDPGFAVATNGDVGTVVPQPDGRVLIGGFYPTIDGVWRESLARALNPDPMIDVLTAQPALPMGFAITWRRGGAVLEVDSVTVDLATDEGGWTRLGEATRVPGGWRLSQHSLPTGRNLYVRARGYYNAGWGNQSAAFVERTVRVVLPGPVPE